MSQTAPKGDGQIGIELTKNRRHLRAAARYEAPLFP
jgi:hypothetical protein